MEIEILSATTAQAEAASRLHIACWQANYRGLMDDGALNGIDPEKWLERRQRLWADPARLKLIALAGAELVGFCDGGAPRDPRFSHCGEIYALYVQPGRQGHGIGARLFQAMAQALAERGHGELMVKTLGTNPQSRNFYERQGCRLAAESSTFEFGGKIFPEAIYLKGL